MNKKKNKKPHHRPKTNPKPKAAIPDPSPVDMSTTEPAKHDAVIAKQPADKPASQKGSEMEKIRWTDKLIAAATVATDKKTHTSAFRYFLRDVPNMPSLTIGQNGETTSEWRFNLSLSGNDAN